MPPPPKSRFRRLGRVVLRIARTTLVVLVIVLGTLALWLHHVGLPDFMKQRLLSELRSRGVEFQFSRIRLRWQHGIVAEHVNFGRTQQPFGPQFFAEKTELRLNQTALKHFKVELEAMRLEQGQLVLPVSSPHQPLRNLSIQNIHAEILFQPGDHWELRNLEAQSFGATIKLTGSLTNASCLRLWQWPQPAETKEHATNFWYRLMTQLEKIKLSAPAELTGLVRGDARDFNSFTADVRLSTPALESPWVSARQVLLSTVWSPPPTSKDLPRVDLNLDAGQAASPWGQAGQVRLHSDFRLLFAQCWVTNLTRQGVAGPALQPSVRPPWLTNANVEFTLQTPQMSRGRAEHLLVQAQFKPSAAGTNLIATLLKMSAAQVQTEWGSATQVVVRAQASHAMTHLAPLAATGQVEVAQARTAWGNAAHAQLNFDSRPVGAPAVWKANSIEEWLKFLEALAVDWEFQLSQAESPKLQLENFSSAGQWHAPALRVHQLHAVLYGGQLDATARLDTSTRELALNGHSTFHFQNIAPLLATNTQAWLKDFSWENAPQLEAQLRLILPAWTNRHSDWNAEVRPTLQVLGNVQVAGGAFRGLPFSSAQSSFGFSNLVWRLPNLIVTRPEGTLELNFISDNRTKDFHWLVRSHIDPKALSPFLKTEEQRRVLDELEFTGPPTVEAEIWGRSHALEQFGLNGKVRAHNFSFRQQAVEDCTATLQFTNQFLGVTGVQLQRKEGRATVEGIGFDIAEKKLYVTNAICALDKEAVATGLGKKPAKTLAPYEFFAPPQVCVNGTFDLMRMRSQNDARFEVSGGPFQWKKFRCPTITGQVHWVGDTVTLTNVQAEFYGGQIAGHAFFDPTPTNGTDFSFQATATEADLHLLMADLSTKTNKLEGILNGEVTVDSANTKEPTSWQGHGRVILRNGLIWEFPIFGIFSPVLNAVSAGLGNSHARQGSATFTIKKGGVQSTDLEIHASGARLDYSGTVDFDTRVHGKMEAELFRNLPIFGKLMSLALWPVTKVFEYKITGTLAHPKAEPVFVPGFLLHPIRSLKGQPPEEPKPPNLR